MKEVLVNSFVGVLLGAAGTCGLMFAMPGKASTGATIIAGTAYGGLVGGTIGMVEAITAAILGQKAQEMASKRQEQDNRP